jgi:hypothetical protein
VITEPVEVREPIIESGRERTFIGSGVPSFYRVEAICPDGTIKVIENVRSYTQSLRLDEATGRIEILLDSNRPDYRMKVGYPYYYLHAGNVLCTLKCHEMRNMTDGEFLGFGLNYNLFDIPWQLCIVLHQKGNSMMALATSRMEWDRGNLSSDNREVQMFLKVPQERHVPIDLMKLMVAPEIVKWIEYCEEKVKRKTL